jgi:hypothetical protein
MIPGPPAAPKVPFTKTVAVIRTPHTRVSSPLPSSSLSEEGRDDKPEGEKSWHGLQQTGSGC